LKIEECVMQLGDMSKHGRENRLYMTKVDAKNERKIWLGEDSCKIGSLHLVTKEETKEA